MVLLVLHSTVEKRKNIINEFENVVLLLGCFICWHVIIEFIYYT